MSSPNPFGGLGQLPQVDRNADLQTLSLRALQAVLPVVKFIFRDQRVDDFGVDGLLELRIGGRATNFNAQVQLKGTDSEVFNEDGTLSLQVRVSNLNYLLNGQSPLYIVHIAPRSELRFVWAYEEWTRLEQTNGFVA